MIRQSNKPKFDHAKYLFTKEKLAKKIICQRVGITNKTLDEWIEKGKWEEWSKNLLLTREEQLSTMLDELQAINDEIKKNATRRADKEQTYVRTSLVQDIKKLQIETGAEAIIETAERFRRFVRKFDEEKAQEINDLFDLFIREEVLR